MHGFGASAPAKELYKHFGITAEAVVEAASKRLDADSNAIGTFGIMMHCNDQLIQGMKQPGESAKSPQNSGIFEPLRRS